jgi:hypothetical protein
MSFFKLLFPSGICLLTGLLLVDCKKDTTAITVPSVDHPVYVVQAQIDIPWPGLASSAWPMFAHDPQHTGRSPYRGPQSGVMETMFNANTIIYATPVIGTDGSVYVAGDKENLFALTHDCTQRWIAQGGGGKGTAIISVNGSIILRGSSTSPYSTQEQDVFAYDAYGNLRWKYRVPDLPSSDVSDGLAIAKDGSMIYAVGDALHALNIDGALMWMYAPTEEGEHFRLSPALSPDSRTIYLVTQNHLIALDTSGVLRWKYPFASPSVPSVDNAGNIYIVAGGVNKLISLTSAGMLRWEAQTTVVPNGFTCPVIGRDGSIYVSGTGLNAFDYAGTLKWTYDYHCIFASASTPAIDQDGTIYLGHCTNRGVVDTTNFLAINPNGTLKFALSLPVPDGSHAPDIDSGPALSSEGTIYVGADYPRGFFIYKIR